VPEKAKAGYLTGYANPAYVGTLPTFRLPYLPVGTYRAFEISGDSMPPVAPGAMVIGRYVEHLNQLRSLNTYILVTKDDGIVYKRLIYKDKQKSLICISDNPLYNPYTMSVDNILEIWSYYCHINFDGNERSHNFMLQEMLKLSGEVEDLDKILKGK
ncbi:MAG: S24 family peptidase, partial [Cytophagales bacterium]|nr:S24 family peptidase [Cytophagales bacterium]